MDQFYPFYGPYRICWDMNFVDIIESIQPSKAKAAAGVPVALEINYRFLSNFLSVRESKASQLLATVNKATNSHGKIQLGAG
jgi:hypothetical protein